MNTIVITGASSGIGKATAKLFAAKGWQVAATMRHPEQETELAALPGVRCYRLDVTDADSIDTACETILADFGRVDVLLNNAGYALFGPLELSSEEEIRRAYDVLLLGPTLVTRKFIPHFRSNRSGVIITLSSVGGVLTLPLTPTYHAAKYGVEGLMEGLSHELLPFNVLCKLVEPGGVQTDFWNRSMVVTPGVEDSDYAATAGPYLANMTQPHSDNRASAETVAEVIWEAATDGRRTWRYAVASADFIAYRRSMTDDEWLEHVQSQYDPNASAATP